MMSINPCERTASATSWNCTPRTVESHESFSSLQRIVMQYTTIGIHCQSPHHDRFGVSRLLPRTNAVAEKKVEERSATTHNSTYVHRRPVGAARATQRCGAPPRHMALRPGWAQGHVIYAPPLCAIALRVPRTQVALLPQDIGVISNRSLSHLSRVLYLTSNPFWVTVGHVSGPDPTPDYQASGALARVRSGPICELG